MRPPLWFALPVGLVWMMWDLAVVQRDRDSEVAEIVCQACVLESGCYGSSEQWLQHRRPPPPPPPPYVVRDFRADPIDDEEILDLRSGRTQALVDRAR